MKQQLKRVSVFLLTCTIIAPLSIILSPVAFAETLQVDYKSFYSHVSKLKGEETQALQFAFGFMNIRTRTLCPITSARISTDKKQIPLNVSSENRFTVPTERALRLADAVVIIELQDPANICDMSVQLETKPAYLKASYSKQDLDFLFSQYTAFFDEMGSFLSFMMPKVDGLTIHFNNSAYSQQLDSGFMIDKGRLKLSQNALADIKMLKLPETPLRITASTHK